MNNLPGVPIVYMNRKLIKPVDYNLHDGFVEYLN